MGDTDFKLGEILAEIKGINKRLDIVNGRLDKHDDKVNTLESFRDNATGRLATVGGIAGFGFSILGAWISQTFFK